MVAETKENFRLSGPSFLTTVNWNEAHHRRSVAASLVQGVYTHQRDRLKMRQGPEALGPPWWQSFNFKPVEDLVDEKDASCFGVVYEFINFQHHRNHSSRPPQYVIAFRGTMKTFENWKQDFKLNGRLVMNKLQNSSRFRRGLESARGVVERAGGPANVWLAGHSLGSALALLVARRIGLTNVALETYLFNPPYPSTSIHLPSHRLNLGLRGARSLATAGLATAAAALRNQAREDDDPFILLSTWTPYLFINPSDPICLGFLSYFKHREDMESIGAGRIERIATRHSIRSILGGKDCEAVHRIPSASLTINRTPSQGFVTAHGIAQWWTPDLHCECKDYHYTTE